MDVMLQFCLMHLARATERASLRAHQIVVVDNASRIPTPPALPFCPSYEIYRCDSHKGFGAACNLAAHRVQSDLILFLNNDVLLIGDTLALMAQTFAAHANLAICGSRLLFPDGTIQHAGVVLSPPPKGPYHLARKLPQHSVAMTKERFQAVTGACMLVRTDVFRLLDGFDEFFSFGYEDIDLCLRAGQQLYDVRCIQRSTSLHFESMTPGRQALGEPTLGQFFERWAGRYTIDG
jgi:GT2 family glycosyltransferase